MRLASVPLFPEPLSIAASDYAEALRVHTKEVHDYVATLFSDMTIVRYLQDDLTWIEGFNDRIDLEMLVTGSDGRGEKATFIPRLTNGNSKMMREHSIDSSSVPSKMDMILALRLSGRLEEALLRDPDEVNAFEAELQSLIERNESNITNSITPHLLDTEIFEEEVELKSVHSAHPSNYFNDPEERWSTRIVDATSLTPGPAGLEKALRGKLAAEVQADARSMRRREQDRLKWYRRVCTGYNNGSGLDLKPGMQKHKADAILTHFDLDAGVAFYDRDAKICSFKYGPLRTVQMQISSALLKVLGVRTPESAVAILDELPKNTAEKLLFFSVNNLMNVPQATVQRLIENYHFFLRLYHQSEWNAAMHQSKEFVFGENKDDRSDIKTRLEHLVEDASQVV